MKALHVQLKNTSARHVTNLDILQANVSRQQSQYQSRQPKAHQIMADEIHNTLDSYQSDISSSEDSFCLQVKIQ